MFDLVLQAALAGISTGLFCCATCVPFIAPVLVAEPRGHARTFRALVEFMAGRLAGYVFFGALFGGLGQMCSSRMVNVISIVCLMLLSVVMILYALGLLRTAWPACFGERARGRVPFAMGLLLGVNICPPFLLSLTYVFTLHSALRGMAFFLVFFLVSSLYFLPLAVSGFLSRIAEMRMAARIGALVVGVLFLLYGAYALGRDVSVLHAL